MFAGEDIVHEGTITGIGRNSVTVHIVAKSGCENCHARGVCGSVESKDKNILVDVPNADLYAVGDRVNIAITRQMGREAIILAYVLPLIILLGTLFGFLGLGFDDILAAIFSLAALFLYFGLVFLLRDKIGRKIVFKISKL